MLMWMCIAYKRMRINVYMIILSLFLSLYLCVLYVSLASVCNKCLPDSITLMPFAIMDLYSSFLVCTNHNSTISYNQNWDRIRESFNVHTHIDILYACETILLQQIRTHWLCEYMDLWNFDVVVVAAECNCMDAKERKNNWKKIT